MYKTLCTLLLCSIGFSAYSKQDCDSTFTIINHTGMHLQMLPSQTNMICNGSQTLDDNNMMTLNIKSDRYGITNSGYYSATATKHRKVAYYFYGRFDVMPDGTHHVDALQLQTNSAVSWSDSEKTLWLCTNEYYANNGNSCE